MMETLKDILETLKIQHKFNEGTQEIFKILTERISLLEEHNHKTLRDEFAMAAFGGITWHHPLGISIEKAIQQVCEYSYMVADAMLKERNKGEL